MAPAGKAFGQRVYRVERVLPVALGVGLEALAGEEIPHAGSTAVATQRIEIDLGGGHNAFSLAGFGEDMPQVIN